MNWEKEVLPMALPISRNGVAYDYPLMGLVNLHNISEDAAHAIFRNAKTYFATLAASHSGCDVGMITECALVLLARKLSFSYRTSAKVFPIWQFIRNRVVRESGFPGLSSYCVAENDLVEFALQHSRLAEVFSAEDRFSIFSDFVARTRPCQCWGSFKRSVKLKEWENGVRDEFNRALASIREKVGAISSTGIEDCSSILPFFAGQAEFDAFKVMYEKSMQQRLYAMIDALASDVAVLGGSMVQLSKSGSMRDNRYHHDAKIEIGSLVKYEFSITVTDIGSGATVATAVKEGIEFWRGSLLLIAVPVMIVSAIILVGFNPTGTFGDIVIFALAIAGAYILFFFLTSIP